MTDVYLVTRTHESDFEVLGVFSTREAAAAICQSACDAVVEFPLDVDCTERRTFTIERPTTRHPATEVTA